MTKANSIKVWLNAAPYSADPVEYDYFIHHTIYRSVLSTLTSNYSSGNITGVLASSWRNNADNKIWTVQLKTGIKFSNGDLITPEIIANSFKRVAILLMKKKSQEGFLDKLVGVENLKKMSDEIDGISTNQHTITFKFVEPIPTFLNHLSFGLYSIVHPQNYHAETGEWKQAFEVISSGPYYVKSQDDLGIVLEKNEYFDHMVGHPRKFRQIKLSWDKNSKSDSDLYPGTSIEHVENKNYRFSGGVESGIAFLRCHSYKSPKSPLHDINVRKAIRSKLYKDLRLSGFETTTSFFPKGLNGLIPEKYELGELDSSSKVEIKFRNFTNKGLVFRQQIASILDSNFHLKGFNDTLLKDIMQEISTQKDSYLVDLVGIVSGILVDEPRDDIVFMFKSASGIQLPDLTGKITKELDKENMDVNLINKEIWDQAVIWPISHFSNGIFYKDFIDVSKLNLIQPPIDFNWIGAK